MFHESCQSRPVLFMSYSNQVTRVTLIVEVMTTRVFDHVGVSLWVDRNGTSLLFRVRGVVPTIWPCTGPLGGYSSPLSFIPQVCS